jgi:hypothetical protein
LLFHYMLRNQLYYNIFYYYTIDCVAYNEYNLHHVNFVFLYSLFKKLVLFFLNNIYLLTFLIQHVQQL